MSRSNRWQLWAWPLGAAAVSLIGLLSALVGDGAWDAVSWAAQGFIAALCLWHGVPWRRGSERASRRPPG